MNENQSKPASPTGEPAVSAAPSGSLSPVARQDEKVLPPFAARAAERGGIGSRRSIMSMVVILLLGVIGGLAAGWYWRGHHGQEAVSAVEEKKQLWTCGMHPQVIQDHPGNCPICGMALEPMKDDGSSAAARGEATAERKIKYWWDPMMNPPYISDQPGKSPMGMDLVPVYEDEVSGGTAVQIDPVVVQNMGVRVAPVSQGSVQRSIRAVGYIQWAQTNIHDVNLRISGWVEKLYADTEGMHIEKGEPLFELYSPEIQVAVEELIAARRAVDRLDDGDDEQAQRVSRALLETSRRKLEQWGLHGGQIAELAKRDAAPRTISFLSPATGDVTEKMLVEGAAAMMGQRALQIVDRSTVWLDAQIYPMDLPFIKLAQRATASIEGIDREIAGEVVFIDPRIDPVTRTAKVRVALPNADLTLRPGMFATVLTSAQLVEKALLVPREAVLNTGARQVVFVASDQQGHFEPRNVKLGPASDDGTVQVLAGLGPKDVVVVSGQFLLDSESRMKEAIQKHLRDKLLREQGAPAPAAAALNASSGAENHAAHAPVSKVAGSAEWHVSVDAVVGEYLKVSETLGAVQTNEEPTDMSRLATAAGQLRQAASDDAQRAIADAVLAAVETLAGSALEQQREGFKKVSHAVLALVEQSPPSKSVAGADGKLFVMYCSMADGLWLQDTDQTANPYYATAMKACGEVKQTIEAPVH